MLDANSQLPGAAGVLLFFVAVFAVSLGTHRREMAEARAKADQEFRKFSIQSDDPRYAFHGSTATVLHDHESWARGRSGLLNYFLTRYAKNEYGEYFVYMTQGSFGDKPFVKHLAPDYASAVLNTMKLKRNINA